MKEFELPALEYCSLDRASRMLGCEFEDILHWIELRAIPVMVKFTDKRDSNARISFNDDIDLYSCLKSIDPGNGSFHASPLSSFFLSPGDYGDFEFAGVITPTHNMVNFELECNLSGFWEILSPEIDGESVSFSILKPFRNRFEWINSARYWEGEEFSTSDLFISRESIEIISGVKQRNLLSLVNFEDYKSNVIGEDDNPKTRNYRAMFIKSLLFVCYGEEAAENPRKFLDNPRSKIKIDFESKGIGLPSGKSLEKWIKDFEINKK